jgi:hypothetical protein
MHERPKPFDLEKARRSQGIEKGVGSLVAKQKYLSQQQGKCADIGAGPSIGGGKDGVITDVAQDIFPKIAMCK